MEILKAKASEEKISRVSINGVESTLSNAPINTHIYTKEEMDSLTLTGGSSASIRVSPSAFWATGSSKSIFADVVTYEDEERLEDRKDVRKKIVKEFAIQFAKALIEDYEGNNFRGNKENNKDSEIRVIKQIDGLMSTKEVSYVTYDCYHTIDILMRIGAFTIEELAEVLEKKEVKDLEKALAPYQEREEKDKKEV